MTVARLALKNLRRKPVRTALLVAVVAALTGTLVAGVLVVSSAATALRRGADRLGADILVVPAQAEVSIRAALLSGEPTQFLMDRSVLDRVRQVDGVLGATPQLFLKPAKFACCYNMEVFLIAFDPETDVTVRPWLREHLPRGLAQNEVVTGRDIPAFVGDEMPFFGTRFRVAAVMDPTGMEIFDRAVFMRLDAAYRMARDSARRAVKPITIAEQGISAVLVTADAGEGPELTAIRIEEAISGVRALVAGTVIGAVKTQLGALTRVLAAAGVVIWCAAFLVLALAFSLVVTERRRELGLLRAMGANRRQAAAALLLESLLLSAAGGCAGAAGGCAIVAAAQPFLAAAIKLPSLFPPAAVLAGLALGAPLFAAATGVLAALLPLRSLLRQDPLDLIGGAE